MEEGDLEQTKLLENSKSLIKNSFSASLPNAECRRICTQYSHFWRTQTRCPHLHFIFISASGKMDTKTADAELARIQAFVLDSVEALFCWRSARQMMSL